MHQAFLLHYKGQHIEAGTLIAGMVWLVMVAGTIPALYTEKQGSRNTSSLYWEAVNL